ncbi:LbetaH domain-containing protein [Guggenheimella bovis]
MIQIPKEGLIAESAEIVNSSLGEYIQVGADNFYDRVVLGDFSYTGERCILQNVVIKKFSNIAAHVRIGPTNHPMTGACLHHIVYRRSYYGLGEDDKDFFDRRHSRVTTIGNDTWIGHGAIIMPEVTIGDGAIVGSGSVVTKDVEPFSIVVGNPAKFLRYRFSEDIREALQSIAWWDWPTEQIFKHVDLLALEAEEFVERMKSWHF